MKRTDHRLILYTSHMYVSWCVYERIHFAIKLVEIEIKRMRVDIKKSNNKQKNTSR